jgi:Sec-independent protein translocase protein TatA
LAIIALAGLLVIGPTKLTEMSREAGKVAGKTGNELKDGAKSIKDAGVPEELKAIGNEFKKGVEEGEIEARGRKAKVMDSVEEE